MVGQIYLQIAFLNELLVFMSMSQWFYATCGLPHCFVVGDAMFKDQRAQQADISQYDRSMQLDGVQIPYKNMHSIRISICMSTLSVKFRLKSR